MHWPTLLITLLAALPAQTEDHPTAPIWSLQTRPDIEWPQLVGNPDSPHLLLATEDGQMLVIDPANCSTLTEPVLATRPGVQFAPSTVDAPHDRTYVFTRHTIHAIQLAPPRQPLWQHGDAPANDAPDDPELHTGWIAAFATNAGVHALDRDSRLILLAHDNGRVLSETSLSIPATHRVHLSNDGAALIWRTAGQTRALLLTSQHPPTEYDLGGNWPLWSTLLGNTLVTITPSGITAQPPDGQPRRMPLDDTNIRRPAIATFSLTQDGTESDRRHHLLAIVNNHDLRAYDLSNGCLAWSRLRRPPTPSPAEILTARGRVLLLTDRTTARACDSATSLPLATYITNAGDEVIAAHTTDDHLHVLTRHGGTRENSPAGVEPPRHTFHLHTLPLNPPNTAKRSRHAPVPTPLTIRTTLPVRSVLWTRDRLILVARSGLEGYKLPTVSPERPPERKDAPDARDTPVPAR